MHVGVDTGGTFTDLVAFDPRSKQLSIHKVSSTPGNPALAVVQALAAVLQDGCKPSDVAYLVHGTTVATNAVLEGKWAKTALITTQGFADVLEIGRQNRPELHNFFTQKPTPLIPRHLRFEVAERLDHQGNVLVPLDESSVKALIPRLRRAGVDSIAVVLLFSYLNPKHERRVRQMLEHLAIPIILSCETLPEFREYERTSTTALNAALVPVVDRYLQALDEETRRLGIKTSWRILQSNAGVASAAFARKLPVSLLLSGPAGGVEGSRFVGRQTGFANLITLDMGGTSCDVSLIHQGHPRLTGEGQIDRRPVRTPMVDIHTIGAGGGSIAWIDAGGALRVGPQSAGAAPGPVCYGRGGTEPTVTDAQLALGRLDPKTPLGDIVELDLQAAKLAIMQRIARPLNLSLEQAASGILAVADAHMERAIRLMSIERGHDPRKFALLAFGGAGPLHAVTLAARLGIPRVILPHAAGVLSAFGLLTADLAHHFVHTVLQREGRIRWKALNDQYAAFEAQGRQRLASDGVASKRMKFYRSADVRYAGQSFELPVPVPARTLGPRDLAKIKAGFHKAHLAQYGHANAQESIEIVNLRLKAIGTVDKPSFPKLKEKAAKPKPLGHRKVFFSQTGWAQCPCFERESMRYPVKLRGPAILAGKESTAVLFPRHIATADPYGHLIVEVR